MEMFLFQLGLPMMMLAALCIMLGVNPGIALGFTFRVFAAVIHGTFSIIAGLVSAYATMNRNRPRLGRRWKHDYDDRSW